MRPTQKDPLAGSVVIMNKKQQQMLWNVTHSSNESLCDVYKTCSREKHFAYDKCIYEMHRKDGFNFRITAANCHFFSCGFLYYDENKRMRCRYYTAQNTYDFIAE